MICGLALMTFVLPTNLNQGQSMAWVTKPYLVQAVIDSARIVGLPSSKAAKAYAKKIQMPDPAIQQITYVPDPVSDRKLFFRSYFK